ncbi:MAG: hypothetical protein JKY09_07805 [Crocinitomicaceae bacterium]|nr:hypothetical protein [Crocinitomicaceae bacterium]
MLNISTKTTHKTKDNIDWQIYQSDTEENDFLVVPMAKLSLKNNGDFIFSLVEYAGEDAGGYCTFQTELDVPVDDLSEIITFLKETYPKLTPEAKIMAGRFDVKAILTYTSADAIVCDEIETTASPFEKNKAIFLVNLDTKAFSLFKSYFGGNENAGSFNISYEFNVAGRLPSISVQSTFNAAVAYSYERKVIKV